MLPPDIWPGGVPESSLEQAAGHSGKCSSNKLQSWMSLILYKTNFKQLDGEGPEVINLTGATTTIGRGSQTLHVDATVYARKNGADIISRRHAAVSRSATNQFVLSDLGAINGTFVNLIKISSQVLKDGDIIQLGGITSQSREPDCFCVKYIFRDKGNLNSYAKDLVTTGTDGSNPKSVHKKFKPKRDVDNILSIVSATDSNAKKKVRIKVLSGGDENRNNRASDISMCLNADATDSQWGDLKGGGKEPDQKLVAEVAQLRSQMEELKRSHAEALSQATAAAAATASAAVKIPSSDSRYKGAAFLSSSLSTDCSRRTSSIDNSSCRERQKRSVIETVEESVLTANNHSSGKERVWSALMESTAIKESPPCSIPERSSCSIDISSLRCNLICAICSLPLLDAVVVSCSHGVSSGFLSLPPSALSYFISFHPLISSRFMLSYFTQPLPYSTPHTLSFFLSYTLPVLQIVS